MSSDGQRPLISLRVLDPGLLLGARSILQDLSLHCLFRPAYLNIWHGFLIPVTRMFFFCFFSRKHEIKLLGFIRKIRMDRVTLNTRILFLYMIISLLTEIHSLLKEMSKFAKFEQNNSDA